MGTPSGRDTPATVKSMVIAAAGTVLAIGLMAWDHLWGNEGDSTDPFPVDPASFFITLALIVLTAFIVFGLTVPRAIRHPESVHRSGLAHSAVALLLVVPASWLGFPAVVAAGGIALGSQGLSGAHRRIAMATIGLGLLVVLMVVLATAFPSADTN